MPDMGKQPVSRCPWVACRYRVVVWSLCRLSGVVSVIGDSDTHHTDRPDRKERNHIKSSIHARQWRHSHPWRQTNRLAANAPNFVVFVEIWIIQCDIHKLIACFEV